MSGFAHIHTNYPQDWEAGTALGYTWHTRWKSSQKSISDNGVYQRRQGTLPISQIRALHNAAAHRLIFPLVVYVCVHIFMKRINGVLIRLFK